MRFYSTFFVKNLLASEETPYAQGDLYKASSDKMLKLYELCFNSFVSHSNKECKLIVDDLSYQHIKKYTNIADKYLLKFNYPSNTEYDQVWSLPKLYCYEYLCTKGDPFLFFDLDMILSGEICEKFLSNDIFAFEKVPTKELKDWGLDVFIDFLYQNSFIDINRQILSLLNGINFDIGNLEIPNCAIFGGNNLEKINHYVKFSVNNCLNNINQNYWNDNYYKAPMGFEKACILEQFLLGLNFNTPTKSNISLLNEYYTENNIPFVLSHIAGDKWLLNHKKITPELLFNVIYKVSKEYKVKYYMDIFFKYEKTDFPELNFTEKEQILFSYLVYNFLQKIP